MSDIKISILVVDDMNFIRESIKGYIEGNTNRNLAGTEFDFDITLSSNAEEAILLYARDKHEIIIMDLSMEKIDGIEATKEILEINPEAKIIGIASEGDAKVEEFKKSGIKFFIEKPFQSTYINSKIDILVKEIFKEKSLSELDIKKKKRTLLKKIFS